MAPPFGGRWQDSHVPVRATQGREFIMQIFRTLVLGASAVVLSSFTALAAEQAPAPGNPLSRMWSAVEQAPAPNDSVSRMLNEMKATARPAPPVVDSRDARIAALEKQVSDLEQQLANRDRELAGLRGDLSAEMAKLNEAQRGLMRALRPEVEQGNITVD